MYKQKTDPDILNVYMHTYVDLMRCCLGKHRCKQNVIEVNGSQIVRYGILYITPCLLWIVYRLRRQLCT